MPEPSNKTALITGASSGLGAEFANQLAEKSYDLILTARRKERLEKLGNSLQSKYKVKTILIPADLSNQPDIEQVIQEIRQKPNLELLINNAGFGLSGRFWKMDSDKELAMLQVHITAAVMFCRVVLPGMISRNQGAIIKVASMAGLIPIRSVLYGSSKAFLIIFSESLQAELPNSAIKVQALCPGYTLTEFHDTPEYTRFSRESVPQYLWMTSQQVVSESLKSLHGNKVICIPGRIYRFAGALARNSITAGLIKTLAQLVLHWKKH
ncbi:MAG: hypothetical protein A2029_00920 [Chloroflexi bacterium RBG_19FT_COMBO_47_9]|nr:MAG: hypothetical protein A2Y53_02965 [Chloroflexi bacterium RBG_16_47_49]OGO64237.1 MAG: hypothetical protein A2029_00920 [Chloroflexi bacterium RBG_19FT_COMBO_47_9]